MEMQYVRGQCLSQYLLFPVLQMCDLLSRSISNLGLITQNGLYGEKIKDQIWRTIFFVIFLAARQLPNFFVHYFRVLFFNARHGLTRNSTASFLEGQPLSPITAVDEVLDWCNFFRFYYRCPFRFYPSRGAYSAVFFNLWGRIFLGDPSIVRLGACINFSSFSSLPFSLAAWLWRLISGKLACLVLDLEA